MTDQVRDKLLAAKRGERVTVCGPEVEQLEAAAEYGTRFASAITDIWLHTFVRRNPSSVNSLDRFLLEVRMPVRPPPPPLEWN